MNGALKLNHWGMASTIIRKGLVAATLIATLAIAGCGGNSREMTRVGVIGPEPTLVDTVTRPLTTGEALLRSNMAQGLVRFDERGQVVPGLAERWNVSDDGLSYIFRLQTGEWPDGRKIKAEEVARILRRQLRSASKNPLKDSLGAVSEVLAMTDRVIEIRLSAPRPFLLQLLAQPELGFVWAAQGTGPFLPASAEDMAVMTAGSSQKEGIFLTHRIRIPDAEDPVEKVQARGGSAARLVADFADGKIDLVLGGTVADLPIAMKAKVPRGTLRFDPAAGLFGLIPTNRSESLREVEVRRLLSRSIDRQAMVRGLNVEGLVPRATLLQSGLEGISQLEQPAWLGVPMDDQRLALVREAQRLFGNAGRPTIRLAIPEGPGGDYLFGRLRYDWAYLGISVERAPSAASADLVWVDEVAPSSSPAWFVRRFRCGVVPICVAEADPLLAEARASFDAVQRTRLLFDAARMMDDAQLFMPVAAPIRWSLVSGRVPGFEENAFARHTLVGLSDPRLGTIS